MKRIIKNNYKIIIGILIGILLSLTSVYAVEAYIESKKVSYDNKYTDKNNTQEAIDELYERSGIHKEKWVDPILNGADPVLKDPLIPVTIDDDGNVYYANEKSEWYNYKKKRWANAIILIDNPSNKNYKVGDHIIEDDIKSYFVWIPRYSYKIWNTGEYTKALTLKDLTDAQDTATSETSLWRISRTRIIDIKFIGTNITETGSTVNTYLTHPAFKLGNKTLSGIWVGKFETGGTSASNMVIKPNVISWRNETVKVFFDAAKNFAKDLDSHMMKNTEWGVVTYLSHSQYGIGTEVNINNTSDWKTGYSAAPGTNQSTVLGEYATSSDGTKTQPWNTTIGYLASTTGNITGIYDMSGGAGEYVAGCMEGIPLSSGFTETELVDWMNKGYIDKYDKSSGITTYNYRILGDATGEMGPFYSCYENNGVTYNHSSWYGNFASFVDKYFSWFFRGSYASFGELANQFAFDRYNGGVLGGVSFRLILAPTK